MSFISYSYGLVTFLNFDRKHYTGSHRDVSMSCDETEFFLSKIMKQLPSMETQEVGSLIQHMLSMAGSDHHELLLRGIFSTFERFCLAESDKTGSRGKPHTPICRIELSQPGGFFKNLTNNGSSKILIVGMVCSTLCKYTVSV